jgi:hypothetical protein
MSEEVKEEKPMKWSWVHLFRSKSFLAVLISLFVFCLWFFDVFKKTNEIVDIIVGATLPAALLCFIFSRSLETAISNMKIAAEIKAGAQANVNADTAKIVEAIKDIKK